MESCSGSNPFLGPTRVYMLAMTEVVLVERDLFGNKILTQGVGVGALAGKGDNPSGVPVEISVRGGVVDADDVAFRVGQARRARIAEAYGK